MVITDLADKKIKFIIQKRYFSVMKKKNYIEIPIKLNVIGHLEVKVRIDNIDKKGIIRSDNGKRTHSLRAIKRL